MKKAYRLFRRKSGVYYLEDTDSGVQKSLRTDDSDIAEKLLHAANEARQTPEMNLSLGKVYLSHADPLAAKRDWQFAIDEFISQYKDSTRQRYEREFRSHAYNSILQKPMIQTTADDLRTVMKRGKKFTNRVLRILHNFALGNGWIHWHIINPKQWPDCPKMPKRAITQDEHQKIIAAEGNDERRFYYQMLWEIGAAQTDGALLTAENFDWNQRILSFQRQKTGQWCRLKISAELEGLAKKLPTNGLLFPKIARQQDKHRAAQFCRRLKQLKIHGISLHSYRYSWAERACAAGIAERFAQAALGHSSKAVHRAYAKKAYVVCPIIETPKDKVIPLVQPRIENQPTGEEIKTG